MGKIQRAVSTVNNTNQKQQGVEMSCVQMLVVLAMVAVLVSGQRDECRLRMDDTEYSNHMEVCTVCSLKGGFKNLVVFPQCRDNRFENARYKECFTMFGRQRRANQFRPFYYYKE